MDLDSKYSKNKYTSLDHFVEENGKIYAGHHYLIDMWNCLYLEDEIKIKDLLMRAAKSAGASVLQVKTHHFGKGQGVSGVAMHLLTNICAMENGREERHTHTKIDSRQ